MRRLARCVSLIVTLISLKAAVGCQGDPEPKAGGLTNWLHACDSDEACGLLACVCGVCTRSCESADRCSDLEGASCVDPDNPGTVALCGGQHPQHGAICMPPCVDGKCEHGFSCVAGLCHPSLDATATVVVLGDQPAQELEGVGAVLAYGANGLITHPESAALLDVMFLESGFDMLGLLNTYDGSTALDLAQVGKVIEQATTRLGHPPRTHMTSGSPLASLKANGSRVCAGDPDVCTLARDSGEFNYAGFASYWRSALELYSTVGVKPDYVSIQRNPNWVPTDSAPNEACRFLPTEGTLQVDVGGSLVEVVYPGYAEALDVVHDALRDLESPPALLGPETSGYADLQAFAEAMDLSKVVALSHHLYGTDPFAVDDAALRQLGEYARSVELPLFQTEMRADGFETALLLHHAFAEEGAALYLQHNFLSRPATDGEDSLGVLVVTDEGFSRHEIYHALRHYAAYTEPGWTRLELTSDTETLMATAWVSPNQQQLSVVLTNPTLDPLEVQVDSGEVFSDGPPPAFVIRTTFDGIERSKDLGTLDGGRVVSLPGHSVVTVAFGF